MFFEKPGHKNGCAGIRSFLKQSFHQRNNYLNDYKADRRLSCYYSRCRMFVPTNNRYTLPVSCRAAKKCSVYINITIRADEDLKQQAAQ